MRVGLAPRSTAAGAAVLLALAGTGPRGLAQDASSGGNALEEVDRAVRGILERCDPAVVRVEGERTLRLRVVAGTEGERLAMEERLRAFGPRESVSAAGFLVDEEGLVLTTTAAAVDPGAIRVTFPRGAVRDATLLGEDPLSGVALVRVAPVEGTRALHLAEAEPRRGALSLLLAPQGEEPPTIHLGFVTATSRAFGNYDAWLVSSVPLTAGHAGAPLLDARGEVMGMAVSPRVSVTFRTLAPAPANPGEPVSEGPNLGRLLERSATVERAAPFATFVPARELRRITADLRKLGSVRRGMLGVRMFRGEPVVRVVAEGLPAAKAGIVAGDRILAVDGVAVESADQVIGFIQRRAPGTEVLLRFRNDGDEHLAAPSGPPTLLHPRAGEEGEREVRVVLGELPPGPPPALQLFNGLGVVSRESVDVSSAKVPVGGAPGGRSVVVSTVDDGSAADGAGIRPGDWILEIGGEPVASEADYHRLSTGSAAVGRTVEVLLYRPGEEKPRRVLLR